MVPDTANLAPRLTVRSAAVMTNLMTQCYEHCTTFDENLVAIHMKKKKVEYNKPIYLGMCILDLSKTLMYDFHFSAGLF